MQVCLSKTDKVLEKYEGAKGAVIPVLQELQQAYGFLPEEAFIRVSQSTGISLAQLYGVATFYAQFRLAPRGKYTIRVCHGTACHVSGSEMITEALENELKIKNDETTKDHLFTLEKVACLGCCSLAPAMTVSQSTYGRNTPAKASKIIRKLAREDG